MDTIENTVVAEVFENYPKDIRQKLFFLRQLILETASETEGIGTVEETLKWGEPSYLTKGGSTVRIDWKHATPHQYAMYFNCQTQLVNTFKALYRDQFKFEGTRAIIFGKDEEIPTDELKHCILLSLTYHHRKHLPMLGA